MKLTMHSLRCGAHNMKLVTCSSQGEAYDLKLPMWNSLRESPNSGHRNLVNKVLLSEFRSKQEIWRALQLNSPQSPLKFKNWTSNLKHFRMVRVMFSSQNSANFSSIRWRTANKLEISNWLGANWELTRRSHQELTRRWLRATGWRISRCSNLDVQSLKFQLIKRIDERCYRNDSPMTLQWRDYDRFGIAVYGSQLVDRNLQISYGS